MSKAVYRSFAGGEITPELVARADLPQHQTGLALCENMIVRSNGTLVRRGGLEHVCHLFSSSRGLMPYRYPQIIPYELASGDQACMVTGIDELAKVPTFYLGEPLAESIATIVSVSAPTVRVTFSVSPFATGGSNFLMAKGPLLRENNTVLLLASGATLVSGLTYDVNLSVVGQGPITSDDAVRFGLIPGSFVGVANAAAQSNLGIPYRVRTYAQDNSVLTALTYDPAGFVSYSATEVTISANLAVPPAISPVNFSTVVSPPAAVTATATVAAGANLIGDRYYVASVGPDGTSESFVTQSTATAVNQLDTTGNYNTISWTPPGAGPTPVAYRVYVAPAGSSQRLFLGETAGLTFVHDKKTPVDHVRKPVTVVPLFGGQRAVTHHEQRRWFAGSIDEPQTLYASRIGAKDNYTYSTPLRADDGLRFRINSGQQASIRHLVTFIDLLAFTSRNVFRVYSPNEGALSPSSLAVKPQGNVGSNFAQPAVTPTSVLFAQANGDRLRELTYQYQGNGFAAADVSAFASHLFYGNEIVSISYGQSPDPVAWVTTQKSNTRYYYDTPLTGVFEPGGNLLGMSYAPEYELRAWHRHTMSGEEDIVLDAQTLREAAQDVLYLLVGRWNDATSVFDICLERMVASNTLTDHHQGAHLDRHVRIESVGPLTAVNGLVHLAGKQVSMLLDETCYTGTVDANGLLTLPVPSERVIIGLPYTSRVQTLPMWAENAGTTKNATAVRIRVLRSSFLRAGPTFDRLTEHVARQVGTSFDSAEPLGAFEARMAIGPSWNNDGSVCIEQSLPLPLTISGLVVEYASGG